MDMGGVLALDFSASPLDLLRVQRGDFFRVSAGQQKSPELDRKKSSGTSSRAISGLFRSFLDF
jgi:c-di-GMP-binding flagellar brake protein YcgR